METKEDISRLLVDKTIKAKEKTELLSSWILEHKVKIEDVVDFAKTAKDPVKATCIEAFEFATRQKPEVADKTVFEFVTESLAAKAPRVKWESAKVVGNTAHLFTGRLDGTIVGLLDNTEHEGTVVRWSSAFALGQIIKLKTKYNKELLPSVEAILEREEKNSIKKIYFDALKKIKI
ncbi:MAG: hypothetical protein JNL60_06960 [Bacteroidia bacterium]|nr:hypothetical protein [Bacteroidia bacterium]